METVPRDLPAVVLVAGLPATGKSFFSRRLAAETGARHVCADELRTAYGCFASGDPDCHDINALVCEQALISLDEGLPAIIDATSLTPAHRTGRLGLAAGGRQIIVWCEVDEDVAAARFERRAAGADPLDYSRSDAAKRQRMARTAVSPSAEEADVVFCCTPDTFNLTLATVATIIADDIAAKHRRAA